MANHAGPQNIGNPLYTLYVSPINVSPVLLPILNKHKYLPKVVYFWTDDDKEDFELKPVRLRSNLTPKETGLTVAGQ